MKRLTLSNLWPLSGAIILIVCLISVEAKEKQFDVGKLIEYNSLATCIAQIHKEFAKCNTNGAEKAKSAIGQLDLGEEWGRRLKCCGMWKLRDCWMKAARVKCSKEQADQIYGLPSLFMPELATECHEYTPESGKCSIPLWVMASVGSLVLLFALLIIFGCIVCVKRFRTCQRNADIEDRYKSAPLGLSDEKPVQSNDINGLNGEKKPLSNGTSNKPSNI